MASEDDLYKLLGVSPTATQDEIKKAYRAASLAHHPDRHGGSTEKMQAINYAYEILSDPSKRQEYDDDDTDLDSPVSPAAGASEFREKSGGYCAGCTAEPCTCFNFKPAGSAGPSNAPKTPSKCFKYHWEMANIRHVKLSCGCCLLCYYCADQLFSGNPHRLHPSPHTGIEIGLDEVKSILSPGLWQKCTYSRQPICYFCKTPSPEFVPGLCPDHKWCRTCFVNIYSVAIRPPGCCLKMDDHRILWDHLPWPVKALYGSRIRPSCNAWKDSDEQRKLKSDLKDWQDKNRDIVFSAVAREALKDKDARIQDLKAELKDVEAQLKACNEKCSEYQKKRATESSASNLNDELVRQRMKIQELERSNKILRESNTREQAKFVEAGRARKIAVDKEAALKKQNEDLTAQLAAAKSTSGQHNQAPPADRSHDNSRDSRGRSRSNILDDLAMAKAAAKVASTSNAACERRIKELGVEILRVRQDAQKQQRSFVDSNKKIQIQLAAAKAAEKIAHDNNDAAQQQMKDLEAKVGDLQRELENQAQAFEDGQPDIQQEVVAAQLAEKAAVTAEANARKQLEELKAHIPTAFTKDTCTQTTTGGDATPETPVGLLKAQLHYAKSLQTAAEKNAMLALDETLDLRAQLKKYHKFEGEAKKEFDKANKMYSSLQHKYERAMASLQRFQEQQNGAIKISASQFANDVNDDGQSAGSFRLLKLSEQLEPVKTQIRNAQAKKSRKTPEAPLKIAARRNRRLRDIIKEREQEIANVRIDYGNKWMKVVASVVNRDSEIRQLKRKLDKKIASA